MQTKAEQHGLAVVEVLLKNTSSGVLACDRQYPGFLACLRERDPGVVMGGEHEEHFPRIFGDEPNDRKEMLTVQ